MDLDNVTRKPIKKLYKWIAAIVVSTGLLSGAMLYELSLIEAKQEWNKFDQFRAKSYGLIGSWIGFNDWIHNYQTNANANKPTNFRFVSDRSAQDTNQIGYVRYDDENRGVLIQRCGLPSGQCVILDLDCLKELKFYRFDSDLPVEVQFSADEENLVRGELTVTWKTKLDVEHRPAILIDTMEPDEN